MKAVEDPAWKDALAGLLNQLADSFGLDALTWVNDHRDRRLRGMNCRVLEAGSVAVGDPVEVA